MNASLIKRKKHQGFGNLVPLEPATRQDSKILSSPIWQPLRYALGARPLEQHVSGKECRWPVEVDGKLLYCCEALDEHSPNYCSEHYRASHKLREETDAR